jgi:hypothetical protein
MILSFNYTLLIMSQFLIIIGEYSDIGKFNKIISKTSFVVLQWRCQNLTVILQKVK